MARTKKQVKPKEPVRIRLKPLSNGNTSIYLDIYKDGKRRYDFLKLYLIPETDKISKDINANTLIAANAIKAQRVIEYTNNEAGISKPSSRSKMLLIDWMHFYAHKKLEVGQSDRNSCGIEQTILHLKIYMKGNVMMRDVDVDFCKGFIEYLSKAKCLGKFNKPMSKSSADTYFTKFACAMEEAVRKSIIETNPIKHLTADDRRPIKREESSRDYLTINEVKRLINTECKRTQVKQAFIFACLCGLRISDIRALRWGNITNDGNQSHIDIKMIKTASELHLPLSSEAVKWLPSRNDAPNEALVFDDLPKMASALNHIVREWAKNADINKSMCFHVSRHTFATSLLTAGADLYTTSKLLGHKNIGTTQIYADIVNQKKVDAVNLLNNLIK